MGHCLWGFINCKRNVNSFGLFLRQRNRSLLLEIFLRKRKHVNCLRSNEFGKVMEKQLLVLVQPLTRHQLMGQQSLEVPTLQIDFLS